MRIAVLTCCHNRKKDTLECLNSLYSSIKPAGCDISAYLVDDNSTDGTPDAVRELFPEVKIINGDGSLFWNRGMLKAWDEASKSNYDFYLWLNDDVILFKSSLEFIISQSQLVENDSILVGALISNVDGKVSYSGFVKNKGKYQKAIPDGTLQTIELMNGNCVLIPKSVFMKIGKLDPYYLHAIGDFDYALRARSKGVDIYLLPEAIGYCEPHKTLPKWCRGEFHFIERIKNLYSPKGNSQPKYYLYYVRRHFGLSSMTKAFFSIHIRLLFPQLWKQK